MTDNRKDKRKGRKKTNVDIILYRKLLSNTIPTKLVVVGYLCN